MSFVFGHIVADEHDPGAGKKFEEKDHRQILRSPIDNPPRKNREVRPVPDDSSGHLQPGQWIECIQEGLGFLFSQIEPALFAIGLAREEETGILPSKTIETGPVSCLQLPEKKRCAGRTTSPERLRMA